MKKTIYTLSILLFGFSSCQYENTELNEEQNHSNYLFINDDHNKEVNPLLYENKVMDSETFERTMQWASFIASEILKYNSSARNEIYNEIRKSGNHLKLVDLIGDTRSSTPIFKSSFIILIDYYIAGNVPHPDSDKAKPEPPIVPGHATIEAQRVIFINNLILHNCVELYFPNELNLDMDEPITSTAHPLDNSSSNIGIKRHNLYDNYSTTSAITIDNNYINVNNNIIIARPYRTFGTDGNNCAYLDYGNINFADFPL